MSLLLTNNTTTSSLLADGIVPLGSAIHGAGKGLRLNGDAITISGTGYYLFNVSLSMDVTGTGAVSVQLYENGSPIPGAVGKATPASAGASVNIDFPWIVRHVACPAFPTKNITLVVSGAGTLDAVTVAVTEV